MTTPQETVRPVAAPGRGLLLASRGDALTPYLFAELEQRYPIRGRLQPELSRAQRLAVAAATFRPGRARWSERFHKSGLGFSLRSGNALQQARALPDGVPVFQVHAMFEVPEAATLLYVDCTHRQSAASWPAWNPLRGTALAQWYERETRAYRAAEHVFAFSTATRDSLVRDYGTDPARVSVVGAGINHDGITGGRAARGGTGAPTILFIGNDFVRKGGRTLVEAFREIRARLPDARLQLVGNPVGVPSEPGVEVFGRVHDRATIAALYRDADVFCLPSFFDPFGLVTLEAMAHGLPVVTTGTCGVADVITDGEDGLLVSPGDPAGLAAALLGLLTDRTVARELGAAGRLRVLSAFTWKHVADRMAPVLDPLC